MDSEVKWPSSKVILPHRSSPNSILSSIASKSHCLLSSLPLETKVGWSVVLLPASVTRYFVVISPRTPMTILRNSFLWSSPSSSSHYRLWVVIIHWTTPVQRKEFQETKAKMELTYYIFAYLPQLLLVSSYVSIIYNYNHDWYIFPRKWINKPRSKCWRDAQTFKKLEISSKCKLRWIQVCVHWMISTLDICSPFSFALHLTHIIVPNASKERNCGHEG